LHLVVLPFQKGGVLEWLQAVCRVPGKKQQRKMAGVILFYWWNLWKEHNHHVFDQKEMSFLQVVNLIKQDINLFIRALVVDCSFCFCAWGSNPYLLSFSFVACLSSVFNRVCPRV
jgi:hypothetical protein